MSWRKGILLALATLTLAALPLDQSAGLGRGGGKAIIANPNESINGSTTEVRILHIGDSHVQADFFSGEVRRLLRQYLRDTTPQRGLIFPFAVAGSNNPTDYKSSATGVWETIKSTDSRVNDSLGLSGIAIYTTDVKATITIKIKQENSRFNHVSIFYSSEGSFTPSISGNFSIVKKKGKGCHQIDFTLNQKSDSLTISVDGSQQAGKLTLHGMLLEDSSSMFSYNVAGLNGASTASFARCKMLQSEIESINPTIVIISLGTNDAYSPSFSPEEMEHNLDELISSIYRAAPKVRIVLTTPGDFLAKGHRPTSRPMVAAKVISQCAQKHDLPIWNFFEAMGGKGSIKVWRAKGLAAPDYLHLSKEGYKVQGEMFFEWLTGLNS